MSKNLRLKIVAFYALLSMLGQSFAPWVALPFIYKEAFAQEETPVEVQEATPTPEDTQTPTEVPSPTPEDVPSPTPELEILPEVEIVPAPSEEVTPTPEEEVLGEEITDVSPTETPALDETPASEENSSQEDEQVQAESIPAEPEEGTLAVVVMENTLAPNLPDFSFDITELGEITLTTDKPDYAPTDSVLIFGTGFTANETYTLEITSDYDNYNFSDTVTADEEGNLFYSHQLDGTYRPLYLVEAKNGEGEIVATATFTDTDTTTLFPSGQGNYNQWNGDEGDVDETGSVSCGSSDGSENIASDNNGNRESVNIGLSSIPDGSTVTSVQVLVWDVASGTTGGTYQTFVRVGSANTDSGVNLATSSNSGCTARNQIINIPDFVKSGSTDLEVGVLKVGNTNVRVGAIRAVVTYTAAPQPDLTVTKTNNVGGNAIVNTPFTWTLTVTNNGNASATFNNEDILEDDLPNSGATYSPTSNLAVITSGGVTGDIDCDISSNTLECDDNSGGSSVVIPAGGSFSVSITVTPTAVGTLTNPRSGGGNVCRVDPDTDETESNEGNNDCSDSVTVSYNVVQNPTFPNSCGLDTALVLDVSTSIDATELTQMKNAFHSFVNAFLPGTPTWFSVTKFRGSGLVLQSFTGDATFVNNAIDAADSSGVGSNTNWQAGLNTGFGTFDPRANPNLLIIASDGNPNEPGSDENALAVAVTSANTIKSAGTRILALGIGNDLDVAKLQLISGTNVNTGATSDVITSDFTNLATALGQLVESYCGGTITVTKLIDADGNLDSTNDQTPAADWSFDIGGTSSVTDQNGMTDAVTLPAGTYAVSETPQEGYSLLGASCTGAVNNGAFAGNGITGIEIDNQSIVSCTFINSEIPKLTVTKVVVTDNGGTKVTADFPLFVDGSPVVSGAQNTFGAGAHVVSETDDPGYTSTFSGDCDANGNITLNPGDLKSCTITNDDQPGTLVVQKIVINDNGGTLENDDFSFSVNSGGSQSFEADGQNDITVNAGTYSVIENSAPGYETTYDNCNQVSVDNGNTATCTITNDDIAPKLTLVKTVINDNGGRKGINDFPLFINGNPVVSDEANTLTAGVLYTASETTDPGYAASDWGRDCNSDGTITLAPGDDKTCTITNDDQYGHLIVQKTTDPSGDPTQFPITASGDGVITDGGAGTITDADDKDYEVTPGTYSVSEDLTSFPNWTEASNTCNNVQVGAGETVTCTFTNTKLGLITIAKVTDPSGDPENFTFEGALPGQIADGGFLTSQYLLPGEYNETELVPAGWDLTGIECSDDSQGSIENASATINVAAGEELTCTFTNTKRGHLVVEKVTLPDGDQTEFEITAEGDGTITGDAAATISTAQSHDYEVTPGTYSVTETPLEGWDETENTCDEVEVGAGLTETCQITNTKRGQITVTKYHDSNANGIQDEGEETLPEWDITLGELTQSTDENGQTIFENLLPDQEYSLSELIGEGWFQSNISCGESGEIDSDNEYPIFVNPGDEIACNIGNYQYGEITGLKWNDENANGENEEEPGLSGWTIFIDENGNGELDEGETEIETDQGGSYNFPELTPGTYRVCEVKQRGWTQTYPDDSELNNCHSVTVVSSETNEGNDFGNIFRTPLLDITKTNDTGGVDLSPGNSVKFTITVTLNENDLEDVTVKDIPSEGFTYRLGSFTATKNGLAMSITEPTYASPGLWNLGEMLEGDEIILTYIADIASSLLPGFYKDLAWAKGINLLGGTVYANTTDDPQYFVGSGVNIVKEQQFGVSYNVEREEKVLGASTELPATGANSWLTILYLLMIVEGLTLIGIGIRLRKNHE